MASIVPEIGKIVFALGALMRMLVVRYSWRGLYQVHVEDAGGVLHHFLVIKLRVLGSIDIPERGRYCRRSSRKCPEITDSPLMSKLRRPGNCH